MTEFPKNKPDNNDLGNGCAMPFAYDHLMVDCGLTITEDQLVLHKYQQGNLDIIYVDDLSSPDPIEQAARILEVENKLAEIKEKYKSTPPTKLQQKIAEIINKENESGT